MRQILFQASILASGGLLAIFALPWLVKVSPRSLSSPLYGILQTSNLAEKLASEGWIFKNLSFGTIWWKEIVAFLTLAPDIFTCLLVPSSGKKSYHSSPACLIFLTCLLAPSGGKKSDHSSPSCLIFSFISLRPKTQIVNKP